MRNWSCCRSEASAFCAVTCGLALAAVLLTFFAIGQYPGGTALNSRTVGYSLDQNFLSDLGMTVAYDGRANTLGAALFLASICAMVVAFGTALWHFVKRYVAIPASRRTAQAAAIAAIIVSLSFVGVGLTPENRVMSWHVGFTLLAFRWRHSCRACSQLPRFAPHRQRAVRSWGGRR